MAMDKKEFNALLPLCTDGQKVRLEAYFKYQNNVKAARALGTSESSIRRAIKALRTKATEIRLINGINSSDVQERYPIKGVSQYYDAEGNPTSKWVKREVKTEKVFDKFIEILRDESEHLHEYYTPQPLKAKNTISNKLVNYRTADLHLGLLVWHEEAKKDHNLLLAKDMILAAAKHLIDAAPRTAECLITDTGDMVEADDFDNRTKRSGNVLDVDGRYPKVLREAKNIFIQIVLMALEKHDKVTVIFTKGNHDDLTSIFIQEYIHGYFRNEPRVVVESTFKPRKYFVFGRNLLGFAHGHELRPEKCGEVMASDCIEHIGKTLHRYFFFGHRHTKSSGENTICQWTCDKNLPPSNVWAYSHFGSGMLGTMQATVFDADYGEEDTMTFSVSRLEDLPAQGFESYLL